MAIPVKLEVFEGPLDLLLHLIEKNKIDIYDIPIVEITEQYLQYIRQMQEQDMNIVSEFLVMAATLVDIKCRMLLPKEINEEGEEEDPRAELVQKLLEYKMYKFMSFELKDRQVDAARNLYREQRLPKEVAAYRQPIDYEELLGDLNLNKLHEIFRSIIRRQEDKIDPIRSQYGNIEKDEIDMDEKTLYVEAYAKEHKQFSFRKLLEKQTSRMEIIVTFLIILELMKTGKITVCQEEIFDDIMIISNAA
ncbi:MAG: segregation/condensation protein A [Candidatus Gastranaerophilales bacterium]|nr:segregation/condensation protein A [Candidatus Gastranaerophilales bacterium]